MAESKPNATKPIPTKPSLTKPVPTRKPPAALDSSARIAGIPALVSLFSFFYYFRHSDLLLYGDAVAHINIARRVFDSQTPGLLQLGTVWLPLPHLLMIPFIFLKTMWQNGTGGSIPSMIAYVFGVLGIFRLVRDMLAARLGRPEMEPTRVATELSPVQAVPSNESPTDNSAAASIGAWTAAFAYAANPNLIYMQATAMTESIYLALFIWAVVYFAEFLRELKQSDSAESNVHKAVRRPDKFDSRTQSPPNPLMRSAWFLVAAELTRYDGWFLAGIMGVAAVVIGLRHWQNPPLRKKLIKFAITIALAPILWLAYNAIVYGNALEFANGPYSAKAIEERVAAPNPAFHNVKVAASFFLKSAQLNMADANWGRFWLAAALLALFVSLWKLRAQLPALLLLWVPLIFYSLSIAYGSVPIHVYTWWPFATFNQRYGLQLLPVFAASSGLLTASVYLLGPSKRHGGKLVAVMLALVIGSYAMVWNAGPQCFQEAQKNWTIRAPLNASVERVVSHLPSNSRYLMDLGEHVGVMEQAGIPLRQVINNENHRAWKRPSDPEGLWERALADPPRYVDFVIAFDSDPVDRQVNYNDLSEMMELHATGQPHVRIYKTNPPQPAPTGPSQP